MRSGRYRERHAGAKLDDLFVPAELAPHAPMPRDEVPDLLDGMMGDGGNEKTARPPRGSWHSTRTSEPSGAIAAGTPAMRFVSNFTRARRASLRCPGSA